MAKPRKTKKALTLADFAVAVHKDYLAISKSMVTKQDLKQFATKGDLYNLSQKIVTREEFRDLHSDVKMVRESMVSKADLEALREELLWEIKDGKHVDDLRGRLALVEQKLGIKPARRAA